VPTASPTIIIAGAGIGGLTASLALAAKGYHVIVLEQAERLEEAGAGLQLSPNASRILIGLGLGPAISARAVAPEAVSIMSGPRGIELSRLPLTDAASSAMNAPYWVVHRADLQAALAAQVNSHPNIELRLGMPFKDVANDAAGIVVSCGEGSSYRQEHAAALIGADGIWSSVRQQIFPASQPSFGRRIAWRGMINAQRVHAGPAPRRVQLWMGANAHLVIYPVSDGRQLNVVAITSGQWREPGWSAPADTAEVTAQFMAPEWSEAARTIVQAVPQWRKWALFMLPEQIEWTRGSTALLGDAAHAMLPFAAQGAGMAIEDAAVLASCFDGRPTDIPAALRRYADLRQPRVKRVQRTAEQNGRIYHLSGPLAVARDLVMRAMGGQRLLARQNWIYDWHG
jgi:salicylate hydroxylase